MPLRPDAEKLIRKNLAEVAAQRRPRAVVIADLTEVQLTAINEDRAKYALSPVIAEVIFDGRHLYNSRVLRDCYTVDDVVDMITSAMSTDSVFKTTPTLTGLQNMTPRADRYGNQICDMALLECSMKHPRPELFGIIPKGDAQRPPKPSNDRKKKGPLARPVKPEDQPG